MKIGSVCLYKECKEGMKHGRNEKKVYYGS